MAAKDASKEEKPAEAPKKTSKVVVLLLAAVLVAVLGVGGTVAYVLTKKPSTEKKAKEEEHKDEELSFIPLDSFTVNLKGTQERFAQVFVTLSISDPKTAEPIKARQPVLRDRILKIIGRKTPEELLTSEGKEKLAKEILAGVRESLPADLRKGVQEVLFTNFIIQ